MSLPLITNHPDYTKGRWRCLATRSILYRSGVQYYSPDFVSFFGDWMSMPSEYDLDSNGEPRYDDVMSFIKRKNYFVGNFIVMRLRISITPLLPWGLIISMILMI